MPFDHFAFPIFLSILFLALLLSETSGDQQNDAIANSPDQNETTQSFASLHKGGGFPFHEHQRQQERHPFPGHRDQQQDGRSKPYDDDNDKRSFWDWFLPWRWYHYFSHHHKQRQHNGQDGKRNQTGDQEYQDRDNQSSPFWNETDDYGDEGRGGRRHKTVTIRLSGGPIRGLVSYAAGPDNPAYVFRGVPMAEPPLGDLRFRPLQRKSSWHTIVDATKYSPACLSNTTRTTSPQHYISEDCLYMNVFTDPKCMTGKRCPVLFYIHGGGFVYDSAVMFNDTQIVQKYASDGIVFVIPAYRLGVFGFLDLGNDRTVKRNLGLHDIIFALEWAHEEIDAFGGDSKRITIMGNSAGGSAVAYLCSSPKVSKDHFQQAVISSGVPFFTKDTNLPQSNALLEHFNCTNSDIINRTSTEWERVQCLRQVDSLELLRQQQRMEEEQHLLFAGPESDSELLPTNSFVELLKYWKIQKRLIYVTTKNEFEGPSNTKSEYTDKSAKMGSECKQALYIFGYFSQEAHKACQGRSMLALTTKWEMSRWEEDTVDAQCFQATFAIGLISPAALNACIAHYNETFLKEKNMRVSYESMHAEAFLTALVNTRFGGHSYVGEFELANYSNHANDMYFFIGLHPILWTKTDAVLMDGYYPRMIRNFLHGKAPDKDWKPQSWNGRNYFRITFNVSDNGTLLDWPHNVNGYQDVAGLDFWLRELAEVERNASEEAGEAGEKKELWKYVFGERNKTTKTEKEQNKLENNNTLEKSPADPSEDGAVQKVALPFRRSSFMAAVPPPLEMLGTPFDNFIDGEDDDDDDGEEDGDEGKDKISDQIGIITTSSPAPPEKVRIVESLETSRTVPCVGDFDDTAQDGNVPKMEKTAGGIPNEIIVGELGKVWSAFWLTLTVTILLALAVVVISATKMIYRHKNQRGYSYNTDDSGFFTEKTRIVSATNDANGMRYM